MAFPTIRSVAGELASTTTIPYPATVRAGDTLLWFNSIGSADYTETGWTLEASVAGFAIYTCVFSKVADGTEGGTTFTADSARSKNIVVAVNAGATPEIDGTCEASTSSRDCPDPPIHSPAGGARDYLWLAYGGSASNFIAPIGAPTDYTLVYSIDGLALAYRELNQSYDGPSAFTDTDAASTSAWNAATMAIFGTPTPDQLGSPLFFGCNF